MKLWVSSKSAPSDPSFTYCDSLLSAYEKFYAWKKYRSDSQIAGKNAADGAITEIYCDKEYFDVISKYCARQYVLMPMPKIRVI